MRGFSACGSIFGRYRLWKSVCPDLPNGVEKAGPATSTHHQFILYDEAGGFPSRYIGQGGMEFTGYAFDRWSYRVFGEFAATSCQFNESSELFNCAYNHSIYNTGYRYKSRAIGHSADNDSRVISAGFVMVDDSDQQWRALVRFGALNRGGAPDPNNTLTPTRQDFSSVDVSHSRVFSFGVIDVGIGLEQVDDIVAGWSSNDVRAYLQWRSSY
jgi:hypothetical protein